MKTRVEKKYLMDALTILNTGFGRTGSISMKFEGNRCTLESFDVTMSIKASIPSQKDVKKLPSKPIVMTIERMLGFLKAVTDKEIEIGQKATQHTISASNSKINTPMAVLNPPTYPELDSEKGQIVFLNSALMCNLAKAMVPIISGAVNNVMLGAHIKVDEETIKINGTDSFRLAFTTIKKEDNADTVGDIDFTLPLKALTILDRFGGNECPLLILASDGRYQMDLSDGELEISVVGSQVSGDYPNISALIADEPEIEFEINSTALAQKCKLHRTMALSEKSIHGRFHTKDDSLIIDTEGAASINSIIEEGFKTIAGDDFDVKLTFRYLLDAIPLITVSGSEKIKLGISSKTKFVWVRPKESQGGIETACVIASIG